MVGGFMSFSFRPQHIEKAIIRCMKWSFVTIVIVPTKGMIRMPIQQNNVDSAEMSYRESRQRFENFRKHGGRFIISRSVFETDLDSIFLIFSKIVPVRCEYLVYMEAFEYIGWSEYFDEISHLVDVPVYTILVKRDGNGERKMEVVRET